MFELDWGTDLQQLRLRAGEIELWLWQAGDVNPLIVGLTKNQGTIVKSLALIEPAPSIICSACFRSRLGMRRDSECAG